MSRFKYHFIVLICLLACAAGAGRARAQDVFRNPAMEQDDESQQVYNKARQLMFEGKFEEAIKEYENVARMRGGKCAECFHMIGRIYFQMQEHKKAASSFRQAVELKPQNEADLYNALGVALYLQDDKKVLDEAIAAFNRAIELGGKGGKVYYNLGYTYIKAGKEAEGVAALKKYLEQNPAASEASAVKALIANPKLVKEKFALNFKVTSHKGDELSLDKLKGKIVLLDFWATWCGPCIREMPELKSMWKKYGGDNFVIIGINLDQNRDNFEKYIEQEEITWPQYVDGKGKADSISALYNVRAIPHTVLIDQDGIIRAVGLRGPQLSNKIGELLKTSQKSAGDGSSKSK